jgi:hypothetical protein
MPANSDSVQIYIDQGPNSCERCVISHFYLWVRIFYSAWEENTFQLKSREEEG